MSKHNTNDLCACDFLPVEHESAWHSFTEDARPLAGSRG